MTSNKAESPSSAELTIPNIADIILKDEPISTREFLKVLGQITASISLLGLPELSSAQSKLEPGTKSKLDTPTETIMLLNPDELKTQYDQGLDLILKKTPHKHYDFQEASAIKEGLQYITQLFESGDQNTINNILHFFLHFRKDLVRWAKLYGPDPHALEVMESPSELGLAGWLVAIPPDHPLTSQLSSIATSLGTMGEDDRIMVVGMQPLPLSPEVAGLIEIHELFHIYQHFSHEQLGDKKTHLKNETPAYQLEMLAANSFTDGKYHQKLTEILKNHKLQTLDSIFSLIQNEPEMNQILAELDPLISQKITYNVHEKAFRTALYIISLCFSLIKSSNLPSAEKIKQYALAVEKLEKTADTQAPKLITPEKGDYK